MKNILTPFILIVCVHNIFGQEIRDVSLEKSVISLNVLAPGLSGEFALNKKSSIYLQGGLGFSFLVESTNGDTETEFIAQPFLLAQYRNYYNFERRSLLQKNTDFNSGNFLGFMVG